LLVWVVLGYFSLFDLGLVGASDTQPALIFRIEADPPEKMIRIKDFVEHDLTRIRFHR